MNKLAVLPLLTPNREPLRPIHADELTSPLARALMHVPALARHMDRSSHNALSATDRSCYHAIARHELWRDRWEPCFRASAIGPIPRTPAWLSHRDVAIGVYSVSSRTSHVRPRLTRSEVDVAYDNMARAGGRSTYAELFPHEALQDAIEARIAEAREQLWSVIRWTAKAAVFPVFLFCVLLVWAFTRVVTSPTQLGE